MRIILDTHVLLWTLIDDPALGQAGRDLLLDPEHEKFVSVVSLWEIAIKHARNRGGVGDMPIDAATTLAMIGQAGFHILEIKAAHAVAVGTLPALHADPFDRLLVAQAISEPMHLMTRDRALSSYGDRILYI